jgi:hypothetical protein
MTEDEQTTFEIPQGYRSLEVGEIRQEGDYFWSDQSNTWKPTKEVGSPATTVTMARLRYIRKVEHRPTPNEEYGTW